MHSTSREAVGDFTNPYTFKARQNYLALYFFILTKKYVNQYCLKYVFLKSHKAFKAVAEILHQEYITCKWGLLAVEEKQKDWGQLCTSLLVGNVLMRRSHPHVYCCCCISPKLCPCYSQGLCGCSPF